MSPARLVFAATPAELPAPRRDTTCVVLDTTWTPSPGGRGDVIALRQLAGTALREADLFEEALACLDAWGSEAAMVDLLAVDGVTYWYRLRETAWHWLHERLIWERVIAGARGSSDLASLVVPGDEPALLEVAAAAARAAGSAIVVTGDETTRAGRDAPGGDADRGAGPRGAASGSLAARLGRILGGRSGRAQHGPGARSRPGASARPGAAAAPTAEQGRADAATAAARGRLLADRVRQLAADPPGPILVLTNTRLQQRIGDPGAQRLEDPNLGPVIDRLRRVGLDPVVIGLGLDQSRAADWQVVESQPRLLPQSVLRSWRRPGDAEQPAAGLVRDRVRAAASVPLAVEGVDLAPALAAWLADQAGSIVGTILAQVPRIAGLVDALRPRALLLTHEGIQTAWLQVARDRGLPTFAVQHGMIYPTHPGYRHPRDPRLPLPSTTFVTGPYERDVLLRHGGYAPPEVAVVGSPRLEMDRPEAGPLDPAERAGVRREMGVGGDERMLVVSTGFLPLQRRFVLAATLERLFEQPLPGVHVVFKQHPGEGDEGPYREILLGLARAGGFAPPPITVVRDVDLYRLLRAADAHLGILSTVLTDAVAAGAPNLIAVDQAHADLLGYVEAGVARPIRDATGLRAALADPRPPAAAARRAFLEAHLAPGPASERIVAHVAAVTGAPA